MAARLRALLDPRAGDSARNFRRLIGALARADIGVSGKDAGLLLGI
jgi:hypothetical protein